MKIGDEIEITETHSAYPDGKTLRQFGKGERYTAGETVPLAYAELICGEDKRLARPVAASKAAKKAGN